MTEVRKGQAPAKLTREQFGERYRESFRDPAFDGERSAIGRLEQIAWQAYEEGRKAPLTRRIGQEGADPDYEAAIDWLDTRDAIRAAQRAWGEPATPSRVLLVCGSPRNDGSCPGEISKSFRLSEWVAGALKEEGMQVDRLDLSLLTSEFGRRIFPCKGCVSTAMPLCHWPCSCYPNPALGQTGDWMNELYPRWVAAHGVVVVTPVHWYMVTSPLKLMMDRLVCADGGNPDVSSTHGKKAAEAKDLELAGWDYPQHLAGRVYGMVVHGDVAGIEGSRRALSDWMDWMGLVDAGATARIDRFIGYYGPYATSHEALDRDLGLQAEARNVGRAVAHAVRELRAGRLRQVQPDLERPRMK
jgi:multimeric flavodoxin WrbA